MSALEPQAIQDLGAGLARWAEDAEQRAPIVGTLVVLSVMGEEDAPRLAVPLEQLVEAGRILAAWPYLAPRGPR